MKKVFSFIAHIFIVMLCIADAAQAASKDSCKTFRIVFEETTVSIPQSIYANKVVIGKVERSETIDSNSLVVYACIENKHSGKFEKNSVCYVSKDQIIVYNVWSTGIDLKEGESVRGFTDRYGLYVYEAKEMLFFVKDVLIAFMLEISSKVFGDGAVSKAKDILGVIVK